MTRAIELVRENLQPGDVILVKGRDTQKLERVSLGLLGHTVRCDVRACDALTRCDACPMLDRGWDGLRVVI